MLGYNSLYGLASQGLKHIGLGKKKKKKGGRKMLPEDDPRYEPEVKIQPYEVFGKVHKVYPHDIPRPRRRKMEGGCMDCKDSKKSEKDDMEKMDGGRRRKKVSKIGGDKKEIRVRDVMKYKYDNNVSLKEAWKHFKNC